MREWIHNVHNTSEAKFFFEPSFSNYQPLKLDPTLWS